MMLCRSVIALALLILPVTIRADEPMTRREAREIIDERAVDPVSGMWRLGGDGALVSILPVDGSESKFDIYLLDSPDMSVIPGAKIGSLVSTETGRHYDAELLKEQGPMKKRMRYIFSLESDSHLSIKPYKQGKRFGLRRWLPYLFRISVTSYDTRPSGVDGAEKVYPRTAPTGTIML